ncbi:MAG: hypothetical protein ACKOZN_09395 [Cyanobium sp.]
MTCSALLLRIGRIGVRDQHQEDLESGSVGGVGIELKSSGKQCCSIKALKALALAFSRLSCSVSFSICSISLSSCYGYAGLRLHPQLVLHLALLELYPALLELQHPQLVAGIPSPVERRAQVARCIAQTHQQLSPPRQRCKRFPIAGGVGWCGLRG